MAEACEKHLQKGLGVRVVGRLKQDRWTDDQGSPLSRIKVVGEHVKFKSHFTGSASSSTTEEGGDIVADEAYDESNEVGMEEVVL